MPGINDILDEPGGEKVLRAGILGHAKEIERLKRLSVAALRAMPKELRYRIADFEYDECIIEAFYRENGG